MKILHLLPYLPTPANFGGAIRIYYILRHLSRNHDVTVAGYREGGDLELFGEQFPDLLEQSSLIRRNRTRFHRLFQLYSLFTSHSYWYNWAQSGKLESQLNHLLASQPYDIVLSEFASMGHFNLETDARRILDAHNVEYDNFRRMSQLEWSPMRQHFYKREFRKTYQEETGIFKKQDAIFATSERDRDMIRKDAPDASHFVIPNGVDTSYFQSQNESEEPFSMVFTGAMSYVPNHDGMIFFLEKIFPLIQRKKPEARIYIVGGNPPPMLQKFASDSVVITGYVDDVRPYIDKASVYVVPLKMGSGTRLKIVEALSMKKPIVSTQIGCEGIDTVDGEHLLIRDQAETFAEAVLRLQEDQSMRKKLITQGYELVRQHYDWNVIGSKIESAFESLDKEPQLV